MKIRIKIDKSPEFKEPKWSKASAKLGEAVELQVTAPDLLPSQSIYFEIHNAADQVIANLKADDTAKKKWTPPNISEDAKYHFFAILHEKPTPKNGHQTVVRRLDKSADLDVKSTTLTLIKLDKAFVPKQEKLNIKYKIEGEIPVKGKFEIWGERYSTDKPIYSETITPAVGEKTWATWHGGKAPKKQGDPVDKQYKGGITEEGPLKGKYLTPEFSPYRLRIILGPDDESINDPFKKGRGKVCLIESQFEVKFESIHIRLQENLNEAAAEDKYKMANVLAVEKSPAVQDGTFKAMGRLPIATESGRIRIPMANHWAEAQDYDQGGIARGDGYTTDKKYDSDSTHFTRPELPIEFELRLCSRIPETNTDQRKRGLFEPAATGPVKIEPFVEDYYNNSLYSGGNATYQAYWKNADHKIKRGSHNAPRNSNDAPIFSYWQARFEVTADDDQEFDVSTFDSTYEFSKGDNELTVYLNRTKLELDDNANNNEFNKDYKEDDDNKKIKLRPSLTKANDILWIIRSQDGINEAAAWNNFPPGTNCHAHYGGIRGETPLNSLFKKDYSNDPGGDFELIIGKTTDNYPYKEQQHINLLPNPRITDANNKQERVEIQALTNGTKIGLAGVIFRPSHIAGDSYVIHAEVTDFQYERDFGYFSITDKVHGQTGALSVWRTNHINKSLRLPDRNTVGLGVNAGSEQMDDALNGRTHPGDGRNMLMSDMNDYVKNAFNEWTIADPVRIIGASDGNPIEITTFQNHGLTTGDPIKIVAAPGQNAAEGDFVVTVVNTTHFTLHAAYNFNSPSFAGDGVGNGVNGAGGNFPAAVVITAATNGVPISITATGHGLSTGDEVVIRDVGGNLAANGIFTVTKVNNNTFTLNDSDGEPSGDYTTGGTVQRCGKIDVHRGFNLKAYRMAYFGANTWNTAVFQPGRVRMDNPTHIQDEFAPFDHYRAALPPIATANAAFRLKVQKLFSLAIAGLDPGTSPVDAQAACFARFNTWDTGGQPAIPNPARLIPRHPGTADQYGDWVDGIADAISGEILDVLTPKPVQQPPKSMPAVRWPRLYHHSVWINGLTGATNSTYTEGFCSGGGQTFFQSHDLAPTLFTHEMGHSTHLSHFVGDPYSNVQPDLCWKHHDLNSEDCLMSYTYPSGYIQKPVGAVGPTGGGAAVDTGWPHVVPAPKPTWNGNSASIAAGAAAGDDTIAFTATPAAPRAIGGACAKCTLKLRGWDEELLPCAWKHPDLF